jgi:hypothetical protein
LFFLAGIRLILDNAKYVRFLNIQFDLTQKIEWVRFIVVFALQKTPLLQQGNKLFHFTALTYHWNIHHQHHRCSFAPSKPFFTYGSLYLAVNISNQWYRTSSPNWYWRTSENVIPFLKRRGIRPKSVDAQSSGFNHFYELFSKSLNLLAKQQPLIK